MKTLITLAALSLTIAAPVAAQTAAERFALDQDSAAERILRDTSVGDTRTAQSLLAQGNDSAAETIVRSRASDVTRAGAFNERSRALSQQARARFALDNDSAAERHVFLK